MAAKQRQIRSAKSNNGRELMRPVISSDVMGNRNVEIVPVGAWVEPAYDDYQPDAVLAAKIEEEKISKLKDEKENRLQSFRRQVKKRVSHASQVKRQQQIQEAEKAFALERKVIQQSYEMGSSGRKDTCSMRNDELEHAIKLRLLKKYGEDIDQWEDERHKDLSNEKENMKVTNKARQSLISKKVSPQSSQSLEVKGLKNQSNPFKVNRGIQSPKVTTVVEPDLMPIATTSHRKGRMDLEGSYEEEEDQDKLSDDDDVDNDVDGNDDSDFDDDDDISDEEDLNTAVDEKKTTTVQFSVPTQQKKSKRTKKPGPSTRPTSAHLTAMLSQFKESETLARQKRQQAAISRRIFMDREREAVRENLRRQEHRKRIKSLKNEKEKYRQELESLAQKEVDVTIEVVHEGIDNKVDEEEEEALRQRLEAIHYQETVDRRREDLKRSREMERYLDALRHKLIEKARRLGIDLPALCACGDILDTHPETCANNCFFYKNNRAYARALQSLLASTEVM